jgi:hypothetical protein
MLSFLVHVDGLRDVEDFRDILWEFSDIQVNIFDISCKKLPADHPHLRTSVYKINMNATSSKQREITGSEIRK